jgi:Domain of unknown function (DUF4158)
MVAIERTAYARMKRAPNAKELAELYTPTRKERDQAAATCRGESYILSFLVFYKAFQRLGYLRAPDDIPVVIVEHIRAYLQFSAEVAVSYPPRTPYRHQRAIPTYLEVKPYHVGQATFEFTVLLAQTGLLLGRLL